MQASTLKIHSNSSIHKLAISHWMTPTAPVAMLARPDEDEDLLRGSVPQVEDWLSMWSSLGSSFQEAADHLNVDRMITGARAENSKLAGWKIAKAMVQVMAESCRSRHRDVLRKSKSISLAMDDKGQWRVIRFKASWREDGKARTEARTLFMYYSASEHVQVIETS